MVRLSVPSLLFEGDEDREDAVMPLAECGMWRGDGEKHDAALEPMSTAVDIDWRSFIVNNAGWSTELVGALQQQASMVLLRAHHDVKEGIL